MISLNAMCELDRGVRVRLGVTGIMIIRVRLILRLVALPEFTRTGPSWLVSSSATGSADFGRTRTHLDSADSEGNEST
jgi:hypothetical protein